eukprot:4933006-Pyramimonas_sp.AAC.1
MGQISSTLGAVPIVYATVLDDRLHHLALFSDSWRAAVQNVQGLNWRLIAHRDKLAHILTSARKERWDIAFSRTSW